MACTWWSTLLGMTSPREQRQQSAEKIFALPSPNLGCNFEYKTFEPLLLLKTSQVSFLGTAKPRFFILFFSNFCMKQPETLRHIER